MFPERPSISDKNYKDISTNLKYNTRPPFNNTKIKHTDVTNEHMHTNYYHTHTHYNTITLHVQIHTLLCILTNTYIHYYTYSYAHGCTSHTYLYS